MFCQASLNDVLDEERRPHESILRTPYTSKPLQSNNVRFAENNKVREFQPLDIEKTLQFNAKGLALKRDLHTLKTDENAQAYFASYKIAKRQTLAGHGLATAQKSRLVVGVQNDYRTLERFDRHDRAPAKAIVAEIVRFQSRFTDCVLFSSYVRALTKGHRAWATLLGEIDATILVETADSVASVEPTLQSPPQPSQPVSTTQIIRARSLAVLKNVQKCRPHRRTSKGKSWLSAVQGFKSELVTI